MFKFTPKCSKYLVCDLSEQMLPYETYAMDFHQAAERAVIWWEDEWIDPDTHEFSVQVECFRSGCYQHGTIKRGYFWEGGRWEYETKEKSY